MAWIFSGDDTDAIPLSCSFSTSRIRMMVVMCMCCCGAKRAMFKQRDRAASFDYVYDRKPKSTCKSDQPILFFKSLCYIITFSLVSTWRIGKKVFKVTRK